MGRIIPYIVENTKCSKPPTRRYLWGIDGEKGFKKLQTMKTLQV